MKSAPMADHTDYTVSIHYDRRLYRQDIAGSKAHAAMLAKQGIITQDDADSIVAGLGKVQAEIESGEFPWDPALEDLHMNIERRLTDIIGPAGARLHTGRSRNDQIALDMRLYTRQAIADAVTALRDVQRALTQLAEQNSGVVMPGYTHLQRAQPVLFAHHMLAYFEMFQRDIGRFDDCSTRMDVLPLGSGALAGVPYPTDRNAVADALDFAEISPNSMDAVADRDFLAEFHAAAAITMMHVSRLSEEIVIWSSREFDFVRLADEFTTGSSIMPQKRNPDFAEIARGKTGRVYGSLMGILTVLKGPAPHLQPRSAGGQGGLFRHRGHPAVHPARVRRHAARHDPQRRTGGIAGRRELHAGHGPGGLPGGQGRPLPRGPRRDAPAVPSAARQRANRCQTCRWRNTANTRLSSTRMCTPSPPPPRSPLAIIPAAPRRTAWLKVSPAPNRSSGRPERYDRPYRQPLSPDYRCVCGVAISMVLASFPQSWQGHMDPPGRRQRR